MRQAAIIKTNKSLIIHSYAKTNTGLLLASEPYFHLDLEVSNETIITNLLKALTSARMNVVHPQQSDWTQLSKIHLSHLKFKSYSQFHKSSVMCEVSEIDQELHFIPSTNHIAEKHFTFLPEKTEIVPSDAAINVVANALNSALQNCEPELD